MLLNSSFKIFCHSDIKSTVFITPYHVHINHHLQMLPACRQAGIQLSYGADLGCKYTIFYKLNRTQLILYLNNSQFIHDAHDKECGVPLILFYRKFCRLGEIMMVVLEQFAQQKNAPALRIF